jgi:seryl-tRNA synthetase
VIDLRRLRQDPDGSRAILLRRQDPAVAALLDEVLELDRRRREVLVKAEALKAARNSASEDVARRKRAGESVDELMARLRASGEEVKALDAEVRQVDAALEQRTMALPNFVLDDVPDGDASANRVLRTSGDPPGFDFVPRPHWELGAALGILDLPTGAKLTGSGFPMFRGLGARLIRALASFMLDLHTREHGYVEVATPYLVNRASLTGTGQLPKFEDGLFKTQEADENRLLYLIPTAEVPLTALHADEILAEATLPRRYTAFTPCYRREAGTYGKDMKGMVRQHQFDKVELVKVTTPDQSYDELESMVRDAEEVLKRLELPYRMVLHCAGDAGFAAAKSYDLEVWLPGQGKYREISSCSNCEAFQARRLDLKFRPAGGGKTDFCHTLNGSGLAVGRTLVAVMENYQEADGSVTIPAALRPYMDGLERITSAGS